MGPATTSLLDRYVIESLLGSGSMGRVYRALDTRLCRMVALKVLEHASSDAEAEIALREARAAAAIVHPNVTAVFDADHAGATSFIVMELVPGTPLRALVGDETIALSTRVRWLVEIAAALSAAHQAGVVHRDIKPENVIVRDDGMAKVLDFGVARFAPSNTPALGLHGLAGAAMGQTSLAGTPAYMAPEQIHGSRVDGRADQFAWGVVGYELLTGRLPWRRADGPFGVLAAILDEVPAPLPPHVPAEVAAVITRALSKKPAARFASMIDAATALAPHCPGPLPPLGLAPDSRPRDRAAPSLPSIPLLAAGDREPSEPPPSQTRIAPLAYTVSPATAAHPANEDAAPPSLPPPRRLRDPEFGAPIDLDGHLGRLPTEAVCKGMFFLDLLRLAGKARTPAELHQLAGVTERRYVPFRDYPMADNLRLAVAAARCGFPGIPLGQALRRAGQAAFEMVLQSHIGRTLFGVLDRDVERLLGRWPKAYELLFNFGEVTSVVTGPGLFILRAERFPVFLETFQVGVLEGALRHCGAVGRVRLALHSLADATFEIEVG